MDRRILQETIMTGYVVATAIALALIFVGIRFSRAYFRLKGERVVTCPADQTKAAVDISTGKAAAAAVFGSPAFTLTTCSHWPERRGCGQACVSQIEAAPIDCLVRTHLTRWYEGKTCAVCHRPIGEIDWYERRPAVRRPDGITEAWKDVDAVQLDDILRTHVPVCFDCHVAETFRRTHPELVLDNRYAAPPPGRA
jgi:hypothetical protein